MLQPNVRQEATEGVDGWGVSPARLMPGSLWDWRAPVLCNFRLEGWKA